MNFLLTPCFRKTGRLLPALVAGCWSVSAAIDANSLKVGGAGWMQYGQIGNSSDTLDEQNFNKKGMLGSGAQVLIENQVSENLKIQAGVGAAAGHAVAGTKTRQGGYAPMNVFPYVAQANFTYSFWKDEGAALAIRGGLFDYDYTDDAQNLGLYLLRGPVYPGYVLSGFETKHVLPVANTLGAQLHHQAGGFRHDLIFKVETEFYPYYDISPAYVASYTFGSILKLGAGVNFYHLIPIDPALTSDTNHVYVDTIGSAGDPTKWDSTQISFSGTKLMAQFSLDPKAIFGGDGIFGPEDLKLFGEVALFGLENTQPYKQLYGDYSKRMPVMVGFNIPAFGFLDRLTFEWEVYKAPFRDDLKGFENTTGNVVKPFPLPDPNPNITEDNTKWSLYASKVLQNHIKISAQLANDHFRPGVFKGYGDNNPPGSQALTITKKDWYWMTKVAFFF